MSGSMVSLRRQASISSTVYGDAADAEPLLSKDANVVRADKLWFRFAAARVYRDIMDWEGRGSGLTLN